MSGNEPDEHGLEHPPEKEDVPYPDGFGSHPVTTDNFQESNAMLGLFHKSEPPPPPPPPNEVIEIAGDSSTVEQQIWADPGLGDRGDPPPPPPVPPTDAPPDDGPSLSGDATFVGAAAAAGPGEDASEGTGRTPSWLIPAAAVGVLLLAAVGFVATRPSAVPAASAPIATAAAPAINAAPVATVAPAAVRVKDLTFATPADGTSVCLQPVSFNLSVTLDPPRAGTAVHVALTGVGMPAGGVTGTVDASGTFSTKVGPVGPVKGRQQWNATVDTIDGKPVVSGNATPIAFCPN